MQNAAIMARPQRLSNFDYRGTFAYSLTFCACDRRRLFESAETVNELLLQISRTAAERQFELLAYCFMPDHLHLLVQGTASESHLPSFVKVVRQRTSVRHRRVTAQALWQDGFYEHTVRGDEDLRSVAEYIANNPVRAGLVATAAEWPFTGGSLLMLERPPGERPN